MLLLSIIVFQPLVPVGGVYWGGTECLLCLYENEHNYWNGLRNSLMFELVCFTLAHIFYMYVFETMWPAGVGIYLMLII